MALTQAMVQAVRDSACTEAEAIRAMVCTEAEAIRTIVCTQGWAIQVMEAQAILDMACLEDSAAASQAAAMEAIRAQ